MHAPGGHREQPAQPPKSSVRRPSIAICPRSTSPPAHVTPNWLRTLATPEMRYTTHVVALTMGATPRVASALTA